MKILTFLLVFSISGTVFAGQKPASAPVNVYCSSADLEAGFQDKLGSWFCENLEKRTKKQQNIMIVAGKDTAEVFLHYIGSTKTTRPDGTTLYHRGIAVTPDKIESTAAVELTIGDFKKTFSGEHISDTVNTVKDWIRDNREVILQKASKQ